MKSQDEAAMVALVLTVVPTFAPDYPGPWGADTALGPEGAGLDSIALLDLLLELERVSGRALRTESLREQDLATVAALGGFLAHQ